VDTQQPATLATSKHELHRLLEDRELAGIPLLILANKIDLGAKVSEKELIEGLNLDYITNHAWLVLPISAKDGTNIDQALEFLTKHSR
jgi:50S ribosomal subunit-associated GTPase HflX